MFSSSLWLLFAGASRTAADLNVLTAKLQQARIEAAKFEQMANEQADMNAALRQENADLRLTAPPVGSKSAPVVDQDKKDAELATLKTTYA